METDKSFWLGIWLRLGAASTEMSENSPLISNEKEERGSTSLGVSAAGASMLGEESSKRTSMSKVEWGWSNKTLMSKVEEWGMTAEGSGPATLKEETQSRSEDESLSKTGAIGEGGDQGEVAERGDGGNRKKKQRLGKMKGNDQKID